MTTYRDEFQRSLGGDLRELIPLIEATVQALDKPGTRALRRKLDAQVNTLVHIYGSMCLASEDEGYCDAQSLPRYKRVTAVWPAQKAYDARKAREAKVVAEASPQPIAKLLATLGLRVVVDNTKTSRVPLPTTQIEGGAA